jgi:hypothetical protein
MARRDERGLVFQIGLHHRMTQTNVEQAFQTTSNRGGRWYGLLTSRDNIDFVAALNVEIEKLLPDAFRNGAAVILFVEPIPKVVILPPLSGSKRVIVLWPYYVCGIGWFQPIESRRSAYRQHQSRRQWVALAVVVSTVRWRLPGQPAS